MSTACASRHWLVLLIVIGTAYRISSFLGHISRYSPSSSIHQPLSSNSAWQTRQNSLSNEVQRSRFSRSSIFRHYGRKKKSESMDADSDATGTGKSDSFDMFEEGLSKPKKEKKPRKKADPISSVEGEDSADSKPIKPSSKSKRNATSTATKGLDFELDDELNDALRSIESGKFDLDEFLMNEGGEDVLLEQDMMGVGSRRKKATKDKAEIVDLGAKNKFKADIDGFDDMGDLDGPLDDMIDEDDDIMLDMVTGDEDGFDLFDGEELKSKDDAVFSSKNITASSKPRQSTRKRKQEITFPDDDEDLVDDPSKPLVIDGIQLDRKEFGLGVDPPPLEEFRRLMDSLGPDTLFEEDIVPAEENNIFFERAKKRKEEVIKNYTAEEKPWFPTLYEGGQFDQGYELDESIVPWINHHNKPAEWRLQIVSAITGTERNSTALDIVNHIYDYIRKGTNNDTRIRYQTISYEFEGGEPAEELDKMIQMWCEGYNTYHLIDGFAMREAWGDIMPHIVLSEKNLNAIVKRIQQALEEDELDGALLTPRFRQVRFRGGSREMPGGFNTEFSDSEFSVVSVR